MDSYLFPAIFKPGEEKGYVVTFPDLPGCITEGNGLAESFDKVREAPWALFVRNERGRR